MSTKLDYYRIFDEAASTLSFSLASQNLYISQSAVSQSIKALEQDLNTKLFVRSAKGVSLTKEGAMLYDSVHHALGMIENAQQRLNNMKFLEEGTLTIGAGDTISSCYLLSYLEQFHRLYPKVNIQMFNRTSLEMLSLIKSEKVDIAFLNLPIHAEGLVIQKCLKVHDIFVGGSDYQSKKIYDLKSIAELPMILLEKNSNSRLFVEKQFNEQGITLHPQIEIGAHELLLQLAKINLGVSCVVKEFSQDFIKHGLVYEIPLEKPLLSRDIGAAYLSKHPLSAAASKFLELILADH